MVPDSKDVEEGRKPGLEASLRVPLYHSLIEKIATILFLREIQRNVYLIKISKNATEKRKECVYFGEPMNLLG